MKATLTTFTALTAVLAFSGAASAGMNLPIMNQPNITAPPPPMILPHIVQPDIVPGIDTSRLAKQKARSSSKKGTKAAKSRLTTKTTRVKTSKAGRDKRVRSKHARSKPLIANPPRPRPRPAFAERLRDRADDLMLAQELARLGDLRERFGHSNAIDDSSLGGSGGSGRSGRSGFDWQGLVPGSNAGDEGPQNDRIWRPEGPGATAYNPGMDHTGGFTRPGQERRDSYPGFSRTPGRAGAGLPGQGGETSQDGGGKPRSFPKDYHGDNVDIVPDEDGEGFSEVVTIDHSDGGSMTHVYQFESREQWPNNPSQTFTMYVGPTTIVPAAEPDEPDMILSPEEVYGPDSQPNPENAPSGESMPCPTGSRGCGEPADEVPWQDKVAQPGAHGGDGVQTFSPSVAERKHAVTNPVPPDSYAARTSGGGRGPRPIEHVTGPGVDDPDTPPGR